MFDIVKSNPTLLINLFFVIFTFINLWRATIPIPESMANQTCDGNPRVYDTFKGLRWLFATTTIPLCFFPYHSKKFRVDFLPCQTTYVLLVCSVQTTSSVILTISLDRDNCQNPSTKPYTLVWEELTYDIFILTLPLIFISTGGCILFFYSIYYASKSCFKYWVEINPPLDYYHDNHRDSSQVDEKLKTKTKHVEI